ncbi:MAG TPA: helix-turn-helix domain-containing protein [Mycobacteriales bacterium]|nr:helix-turn-helix domain-containing protein [Mycobacteriales bacterium]
MPMLLVTSDRPSDRAADRVADLVVAGGTAVWLTVLAAHAGHPVSVGYLVDVLWGADPPASAT